MKNLVTKIFYLMNDKIRLLEIAVCLHVAREDLNIPLLLPQLDSYIFLLGNISGHIDNFHLVACNSLFLVG